MSKKTREFKRPLGERRYKKLFVISAEGSKTERQYFGIFNQPGSIVQVKCLKRSPTKSSPIQVLRGMRNCLRKESLRKTDEAWIVVDKDAWTEGQFKELLEWAKGKENRGLAISNPNFEYWLLLHFEDGRGITNSRECMVRLKRHLPKYEKEIDSKRITSGISQAISRAKQRDANRTGDLPSMWSTTVYMLVEKIINHGQSDREKVREGP